MTDDLDSLDFSLDAMNADPDDAAPGVTITVPIMDDAGTLFASVYDAARFYHVPPRRIIRALKDGTTMQGLRFSFPANA